MNSVNLLLVEILTMASAAIPAQPAVPAPDLIVVNASIQTMDPATPAAEALAISGNRIVVGGLTTEIHRLAGNNTRVIDAAGKLVLPGFN